VQRQMNAEELDFFYRRIGAALWHIQYLEDVLVTFLVAVLVDQRRSSGESVAQDDAEALLAQKRKVTLGPLIQTCISQKVIPLPLQARFDLFKEERHWLVHRSMVESGDELYSDAARDAVFRRIITVQQEAIALKKLVVSDFESWMSARGVDPQAAQRLAEESIRKLKGF
jgi:hypothetical protein